MSWADEISPPEGFRVHSYTENAKGDITSRRMVRAGRSPSEVTKIPDPSSVAFTSTLYGPDGEVRAQWVKEKPEDQERLIVLRVAAEELSRGIVKFPEIPLSFDTRHDDLMVGIPVGDHHVGMLAWKHEVGASYDLEIAERLLAGATEHLIWATPVSRHALLAFLGDFGHYDSYIAVTPTNKNPLDADGRYPLMVRVAVRSMLHAINCVLSRHEDVRVIVEIGNHDPALTICFIEMLRLAYANNPRVTIDDSPSHFHFYRFGQTLIMTHHGDRMPASKIDGLPLIMATDRHEDWGATKYHHVWTGHTHRRAVYDARGCTVESFRVLPPTDAWAHAQGYRSQRGMTAIVYHREHGEVGRHLVNPAMLEAA